MPVAVCVGLHPVVVHGTEEQKRRFLPPLIAGKEKSCFAVTEPNAGLNTAAIKTRAERKSDRYIMSGSYEQAIVRRSPASALR